jgi:hypothetical protein
MSRFRQTRPSPALAISVIALAVAVGGAAGVGIAAVAGLDRKEKKQVRKIAAKQANRKISKRAGRLSVASARSAGNALSLGGAGAAAYVQRSELAPIPPTPRALGPGWALVTPALGTPPAHA